MYPDILYQLDWTQIIVAFITIFGGGLIVWYRKKLAAWRDFWKDVLQGLRSIPDLQADVRGIRYYVAPNGGGSLMDSVSRTETAVGLLTEHMDLVVQTMYAENDSDEETGRFQSDSDGQNTYVNQLYARWIGVGKAELLGWNFMNYVHPDDVARVRELWALCRQEHRQYRCSHRMVSTTGDIFNVNVIATPIPEKSETKRWIGTVRKPKANG